MAVVRINKTQNYTVMSNYHFREKEMSLKAKGLLSLMFSLPDNWDYSVAGLIAICKENETAIKSTLSELQKFGYLRVTKLMPNKEENRSKIEYVYDIFERPQKSENQDLENLPLERKSPEKCGNHKKINPVQEGENQDLENLPLENLPLENQGQLNTNKQNTKKENNNIIIEIVNHLNEKACKNFRTNTPETKRLITKLLKAGFTAEDFKTVIDNQVAKWKGNPEWEEYLRPSTLFNSNKFENYLNNRNSKPGGINSNEETSYDLEAYERDYEFEL